MLRKYFTAIIILTILFINAENVYAQFVQKTLSELMNEDSTDLTSIAIYPQNIRDDIFKLATHPEGIVKLDVIQKKSNEAFRKKLENLSKEDQNKIWNISRHDNLATQLLETDPNTKDIENLLSKFPAEIHDDALYSYTHYRDLLASLEAIKEEFDESFSIIVSEYAKEDQTAFRNLLNAPEVLNLLNQNLHLCINLGDIYKSNPTLLKHQFDSLSLVITEQQAKEKEEWKQEISDNPEAQKELKESTEEYATELGYSHEDLSEKDPSYIAHYDDAPYPYWSGHPWWFESDYWHPYPYWYHFGYYYWQNSIIWIGTPSWYFIRWHFRHHRHHYFFPHLTNVFIDHYYYGPRRPAYKHKVFVRNWMENNEKVLPSDFNKDKEHRIVSIRELGKAEIDRDKYNKDNPNNPVSNREFIKQNSTTYPDLRPEVTNKPEVRPMLKPKIKRQNKQPRQIPRKNNRKIREESLNPIPPARDVQRKEPEMKPAISPKSRNEIQISIPRTERIGKTPMIPKESPPQTKRQGPEGRKRD